MARYDTMQEVFDKVWDYFIKQENRQAWDLGCRYFVSTDAAKCAIGCLLEDAEAQQFENAFCNCSIHRDNAEGDDVVWNALLSEEIIPDDSNTDVSLSWHEFLFQLQNAHDTSDREQFNEQFKSQLVNIADRFQLQVPS